MEWWNEIMRQVEAERAAHGINPEGLPSLQEFYALWDNIRLLLIALIGVVGACAVLLSYQLTRLHAALRRPQVTYRAPARDTLAKKTAVGG